ncbi:multiple monosaccharide ABC transporter substrate-binding protein [Actinomyces vulturis]|uniref:multiple monosaccharide ABC transporter substrate-binding protein n=1 Tax=Actinomyces vulturis TaxID=1857645 RepID=UPI000A6CB3F9|nr:multiple monosaccharide ABC transporter substrate-binding protein [Actinomyces vulturis]
MSESPFVLTRRQAMGAVAATALLGTLAACSGSGAEGGSKQDTTDKEAKDLKIGVAMPTKSAARWIKDGENLKDQLEKLGYQVDLQFAEDDIPTQVNQIDNMITQGANLLIIAPIDGTALSTQLDNAGSNGIPIISYDRLIRDNANVDYYTSFNNFAVGQQMGTSLLTGLGVLDKDGKETGEAGPFNVEFFAGSPDDNNAKFFFDGAMDKVMPFVERGILVVKSGQTDFDKCAIMRWEAAKAQERMDNLITSTYTGGAKVDGVLSPYDGLSIGIIGALNSAGYGKDGSKFPIVTGQDAELPSVKSILAGEQYSTIYKDTRKLADATVKMANAVLKGEKPEVNDEETYNNGVKVVPAYLLESVIITKDNVQKELVDSGYYTEADLK